MTEIYKLARPLLKGVKVEIQGSRVLMKHDDKLGYGEVKNLMARDILMGMPAFVGEIVIGKPIDPDCHDMTKLFLETPEIMSPFIFWVYDMRTITPYPLRDRLKHTEPMVTACHPCIQYVDHELIESEEAFTDYKKKVMDDNHFPGVVLREPFGTFGTEDEIIAEAASSAIN